MTQQSALKQQPATESVASDSEVTAEEPPSSSSEIEVELIVDEDIAVDIDTARVQQAVQLACESRGFLEGTIGVRIATDASIRTLNAKHLGHDYATDVISFGYVAKEPEIEGELIVSIDTAIRQAAAIGWSADHELLLYIVHGTLHITGMDDHDDDDRAAMRAAEATVMTGLGIDQITRFGADQVDNDQVDNDQVDTNQVDPDQRTPLEDPS